MADTLANLKTWACPNCAYKQSHDPADDQQMQAVFWEPQYAGRPVGACPACYAGENATRTKQVSYLESISGTDLSALGKTVVADDTTLAATQVPVVDANGLTVMVQVGEHYELHIDQSTGAVSSVLVPDYAPQMRALTTAELNALKTQRDQNLNSLTTAAV